MALNRPIRVLVADDSAFMRTALSRMIQSDPGLSVAGMARDGVEALALVGSLDPDVVTLDIEMPRMNGLETLKRIMTEAPRPVIMVSSLTQDGVRATLDAFELGAFDCIPKQLSYASLDIVKIRQRLVDQIKHAAARRHDMALLHPLPAAGAVAPPSAPGSPAGPVLACWGGGPTPGRHAQIAIKLVAIGISTGGPKALQQILPQLPAELAAGMVIVQHMPVGFTGPFAERLHGLSRIAIREATQGAAIEPGVALIAPAGWQTTVVARGGGTLAVHLSKTPADTPHIPSVDVMMCSVAEACGPRAMGIIMTGMGCDGQHGIEAIFDNGGLTVGQDEASCAVYGMPRACAEAGVLKLVVPLQRIPNEIVWATRTPIRN
jgi:two-component system chemotaxis response regulator CheB